MKNSFFEKFVSVEIHDETFTDEMHLSRTRVRYVVEYQLEYPMKQDRPSGDSDGQLGVK